MFRADIAVAVFPGGLQDSFEAAPTVSLAMLPAAATKPGVGWRHVTEAGLCSSVFEKIKYTRPFKHITCTRIDYHSVT